MFCLWYRISGSIFLANSLSDSDTTPLEFVIPCSNIPELSRSPLLAPAPASVLLSSPMESFLHLPGQRNHCHRVPMALCLHICCESNATMPGRGAVFFSRVACELLEGQILPKRGNMSSTVFPRPGHQPARPSHWNPGGRGSRLWRNLNKYPE